MLKKVFLYPVLAALGMAAAVGGLFVINGLWLAKGEEPISGTTYHPPKPEIADSGEIRILAYNIAKGFIHRGGIRFHDKETARRRMERIAEIINRRKPDLVFLSEAVLECTPSPLNQVTRLAEAAGMHMWAFGENYNFGLPFYRIVGGNALLSRFPIRTVANFSLSGRKPFYVTTNSRRVLWCRLKIGGEEILAASVHNDSFNLKNNRIQAQQLLDYKGTRKAIMAGDFNAGPGEPAIEQIRKTGDFSAAFDGPKTFPSGKPDRKIDFIFAPSKWKLLDHRVIQDGVSDHYPVFSVFRVQT